MDALGGSLRVDSNGRTTVTGAGSDIDYGATVEKIIEAKRRPAVRIENRIADNQVKVDALTELQSRLNTLEQAADKLRGRPTFDKSGNVFEAKEGFLSATRADGQTASTATAIMTANVENAAQPGTQQLEILRTAQGQQIAGSSVKDAAADLNSAEGLGTGNFSGGDFVLNGRTISLDATDSLQDVRDKINAANTGDNATGVNAQIVSVSDTQHILTLTAETPGESIGLDDAPAGGTEPLKELGIVDTSGNDVIANELRQAQTSIFRVNGLSDGSMLESGLTADSPSDTLSSLGATASPPDAELTFTLDLGAATYADTITFDTTTTSLDGLAQKVNDEVFGVSARVVETDSGKYRIEFNAENTGAVQRSDAQSIDKTTAISNLSDVEPGTFKLKIANHHDDGTAADTKTLTFDETNTLEQIASQIDGDPDLNVKAEAVEVDGKTRLEITSKDGGKVSVSDAEGDLAQALGIQASDDVPSLSVSDTNGDVANALSIEAADAVSRKTNTVDDLFQGVTLNLIKAERGTELQFDVERDQDAVNTAMQDFVTAYNSLKQFINAQRLEQPLEGQDPNAEDSIVGALKGERVLREVEQKLSGIIANGATNSSGDFAVLAQAGVDFVKNSEVADKTLEDTLKINQEKLNDALLNDFDDLGKLFQFGFSSNSSDLQMTGFTDATAATDKVIEVTSNASGEITDVKVGDTSGAMTSVTFDSSGSRFTISEGPLSGLSLLYSGPENATSAPIEVSTSTGIGSSAYFTSDNLGNTKFNDGLVQAEIDRITGRQTLDGENIRLQEEVERIDRSLERERERLMRQFTTMEQALIELESARSRLEQFASAGSGNN